MNIEKIFKALEEDSMNSALGIIVYELEQQGYLVVIKGIQVTSEEMFEGKFSEIENYNLSLHFKLFRNKSFEQEFMIDFDEYHKISFREFKLSDLQDSVNN
ncbi:hypothetical protein [Flavobacterium filum]|uniref:hypothetical protein n=1 Tax=Flavobacterium filum TaxID=370974 RepID=UPI0023F2C4C6|nr:hypothetical protein [Flavobacterium filum]